MIQPETVIGRKRYFTDKRMAVNSAWIVDSSGTLHIPLKHNLEGLIYASDREVAAQFLWHAHKRRKAYYVEAGVPEELQKRFGTYTSLHRVILGLEKGDLRRVDHKDR